MNGELTKAEIFVLEGSRAGQVVQCMFRPKQYSISKTNSWQLNEVKGKGVPQPEFSGGSASTLSMELFFDTYEKDEDVRKYTNKVWALMAIDAILKDPTTGKGRPPLVRFQWGPVISFKAAITTLNQTFTLFKSDGTPVRATLTVTFQEAEEAGEYPFQNPTTGGSPGYKTRTVKEGEFLDWIAFEEYGDPNLWRFIAETNNLENPMKLIPGQMLFITPKP